MSCTNESSKGNVNLNIIVLLQLSNYRWSETSTLECDCRVNSLSWDQEGIRLLMGGTSLQMWKLGKRFTIGVPSENHVPHAFPDHKLHWECIWKYATATEVHFLSFSPDSCLFATAGKFDRLVKVWYPAASKNFRNQLFSDSTPKFFELL